MIEVNSFESFHEDDGQKSGTQGGGTLDGGASLSFPSLYPDCAIFVVLNVSFVARDPYATSLSKDAG